MNILDEREKKMNILDERKKKNEYSAHGIAIFFPSFRGNIHFFLLVETCVVLVWL